MTVIAMGYLFWFQSCDITQSIDSNSPPELTSSQVAYAIVNEPFTYTASAKDQDDDPVEFTYSQLPPWLKAEGNTVSGVPTVTGNTPFMVTANDGQGGQVSQTVKVFVSASDTTVFDDIIAAVKLDSLLRTVGQLLGTEWIMIDGTSSVIHARYWEFFGALLAGKWLRERLEGFGLLANMQNYMEKGNNPYAIQPGVEFPDSIYIVSAHYDCLPANRSSPGANDNASGVAAVVEAARILSQYQTRYTIFYALWDMGEYGRRGSKGFARQARSCGLHIAGVIDLDMIAWSQQGTKNLMLHSSAVRNSDYMADIIQYVNERFGLGLNLLETHDSPQLDFASFWQYDYGAVGLNQVSTAYYEDLLHTQADTIDKFDLPFYHSVARLATGSLAHLAQVVDTAVPAKGIGPILGCTPTR
ncbi:MAG: M28 family peptidase [Fidelibacterota bacterium]|nr:MAG: M28 family peptidase [Candidatus Neomarinimicrobiota bacterium]